MMISLEDGHGILGYVVAVREQIIGGQWASEIPIHPVMHDIT
jgi:hypothetical protein